MKKVWVIVLAVLLVSVNVFAAGGGQQASAAAAGKTELIINTWDDPANSGFGEIIVQFMKENPDVQVTIELIPNARYEDKVRTALAGGDGPDIVQVNDDYVVLYSRRKLLMPVTKYVQSLNLKPEEFYKSIWEFTIVDGEQMGFTPLAKPRTLIFNRDLFKEAGLPDPPTEWGDPSWTYEKFREYAMKLTKRQGNTTTQWGFVGLTDGAAGQIWTGAVNGIGLLSRDGKTPAGTDARAREGVKFIGDLINVDKASPLWGDQENGQNFFYSGQAGMYEVTTTSWANLRKSVTFDWGIAPFPMKNYPATEATLACYGVPATTKNPDLAAKFLFYLGGEFAQKSFAQKGLVPTNRTYAERFFVQPDLKPLNQEIAFKSLEHSLNMPYTEVTGEARRIWRGWCSRVWNGEMDVNTAMDQAQKEMEQVLANN